MGEVGEGEIGMELKTWETIDVLVKGEESWLLTILE